MAKPRVLVAGTPKAIGIAKTALGDAAEVITASTGAEALQRCSDDIALVITHVTFDESRMLDFVQALRAARRTGRPRVVCMRLFGPMSERTLRAIGEALEVLDTKLIDLYEMRERHGESFARQRLSELLRAQCTALAR